MDQPIHEIASPIIAVRNGSEEIVSGTAVIVGPGLALTAYHVIADFVERYEGDRDIGLHLNVSFELLLFLGLDQGKTILPLKVLRIWNSDPLDIAILALAVPEELPEGHIWKAPTLSLLPPKMGEDVCAFGFADSQVARNEPSAINTINLHPRTALGTVRMVHHDQRDRFRLPFPCFQTDARFDGGMSGGPVFNSTGSLCGIICSTLPPSDPTEEHISYACTLWPMMGIAVDIGINSYATGLYRPMYSLLEEGKIMARDSAFVSVAPGENGTWQPSATYNATNWMKAA